MKRGRLPLTALRSFEAAGRLESFTLAAQELFVSQAAISRQVRELEALLGKPLFTRHHRKVRLNADGTRLLETLAVAFDSIDARLEEIRATGAGSLLTVTAEPGFATCWLVPHLADFRMLHPQIDVSVESETRLVEFRGDAPELAIRHSAQHSAWPRTQARHLCNVTMVPVLSPAILTDGAPLATPQDLLSHTLLHEENRDLWTRWFAAAGLTPTADAMRGPIFTDGALTLQAALRGHGVALVDAMLAQDDLDAGHVIQPFDLSVPFGAYFLVTRDFTQLSPQASAFVVWMAACFAKQQA
ncbi:LysR substrate-binding domain-containing protein [Pararhizobium sp. BT-229]|uniref:LysR substrate-binding domain-containing protein n=1 Tax=Pararhizobium sp. BT-229 TaxID=2986923 RepID=UPI0021F7876F|nr:LysR substrate-binding domain-containing protein [Pararhizobium sp. BT-229]MCV9963174.1 LysR substrate-binding domain-containing protein [Pararhizobium sp. BT-229]